MSSDIKNKKQVKVEGLNNTFILVDENENSAKLANKYIEDLKEYDKNSVKIYTQGRKKNKK